MDMGIDEVGRGPLMGNLWVVGAVIRPDLVPDDRALVLQLCKDSKAFSSRRRREEAFGVLEPLLLYAVSKKSPEEIAVLNIRGAVMAAMAEVAVALCDQLGVPVRCLFDGKDCPVVASPYCVEACAVVKGDATVPEIGAASILAKVYRDREVDALAAAYPAYGWERNAGYGTAEHIAAIKEHGLTPHHRSWAQKFVTAV